MNGPASPYAREDIQTLADMRMIALAVIRRQERSGRPAHGLMRAMREIARLCETLIREGPAAFRFIIEDTAPLHVIQHELRRAVFAPDRADDARSRFPRTERSGS